MIILPFLSIQAVPYTTIPTPKFPHNKIVHSTYFDIMLYFVIHFMCITMGTSVDYSIHCSGYNKVVCRGEMVNAMTVNKFSVLPSYIEVQ